MVGVHTNISEAWKRLALVVGSTLFCAIALELALRIFSPVTTFVNPLGSFHQPDPDLGWTGTPNVSARFKKVDFDVAVSLDANGFRKKAAKVQPASGSPVVAVFGDSFTWGWGVDDGKVLTDVAQDEAGPAFDIRNYGVDA